MGDPGGSKRNPRLSRHKELVVTTLQTGEVHLTHGGRRRSAAEGVETLIHSLTFDLCEPVSFSGYRLSRYRVLTEGRRTR